MEYAIMVPHGVGSLPCLERCRTLKTQKNPCHALRPLKSNRTAVGLSRPSTSFLLLQCWMWMPGIADKFTHSAQARLRAGHDAARPWLTRARVDAAPAPYPFTSSNSTSNISVAFGGMTPPALAP